MSTLTREGIKDLVLDIISPNLVSAKIDPATVDETLNLLDSGVLTSFDFLDLIAEVEDRSGVPIDFAALDDEDIVVLSGLLNALSNVMKAA